MLFSLALRNVAKSLPKRLAFGSFFAVTMALLFVGNTLFENSDRGLSATYVNSFTGQASVSTPSPEQFTIFGSDLPMIGEFLVMPILPDPDGLRSSIHEKLPDLQFLPQVCASAALELGKFSQGVPVFGVDFPAYFRFFPALVLDSGTIPEGTSFSILITRPQADKIEKSLGRPLVIGEKLTLSFAVQSSFVIREVTLAGIYHYPSSDQILDRIVLTDPDTARALNGYLYGDAQPSAADDQAQDVPTGGSLDDLFKGAADTAGVVPNQGVTPDSVAKEVSKEVLVRPASGKVEGAWNFLLFKEKDRSDATVLNDLNKALDGRNLQVRNWRATAGGTAEISWFIRLLFNLGLIFIAMVSCLILINSLSLSILERTREIGTMRALGAEKAFVGELIAWESLILVVGMGFFGIALGTLAVAILDFSKLPLDNLYLSSLFGARVLRVGVSWPGILVHGILSIALGLVSVILPVRKALSIQPVKAIAREQ